MIDLIDTMHRVGFATAEGIRIVATVWRDLKLEPSTRFSPIRERIELTIAQMVQAGVATTSSDRDRALIRNFWTFPLWEAELDKLEVDRAALRETQARRQRP